MQELEVSNKAEEENEKQVCGGCNGTNNIRLSQNF